MDISIMGGAGGVISVIATKLAISWIVGGARLASGWSWRA